MPGKFRQWCFTSFEKEEPEYKEGMTYLVYGKEICPDTGRDHWQGYMEFKNGRTFNGLHKEYPKWHIGKRKDDSTAKAAAEYCKKDGKWKEFGKISHQGERNDLRLVTESVMNGNDIATIAMDHPQQFLKYHKGIEKAVELRDQKIRKEQRDDIFVHVLIGPSGCGKTRYAYEHSDDLFDLVPGSSGQKVWFDGYSGEKDLLIDDMDKGNVPYRQMLRMLDRYPLRVEIKGGHTFANWTRVFITSNVPVEDWYPHEDIKPLMRRINEITNFYEASDDIDTEIEVVEEMKNPSPPKCGIRTSRKHKC